MDYAKESLKLHYDWQGKFEIALRAPLETSDDLSLAYTPGVAQPCLEIQKDVDLSYKLTRRGNLVAVVTDGTAVLGLGDIGPEAGMPVMEGKCALFKKFGNVDAIPLCIRSKDVDDIVNTVRLLAGSFGGINLEDISAPRCFEIEEKLKECCDIPIFHDDQHGTAVVTLAAMMNALKLTGKNLKDVKVVTSGAGAAGIAIIRLLIAMGLDPHHVILCDRKGAIYEGREGLNKEKEQMAKITNSGHKAGSLADVLVGADVFIGVSAPNCVTPEMVKSMAEKPILFPDITYSFYDVWADEFKIEEVVTNYTSNALNHLNGEKEIEIRVIPEDDRVRVTVFNTGTPIPEEDVPKLWNKFYKVDKARTREYGGSGIGLSIVKAIIEGLHQQYGVQNYDNGVEFWFTLDRKND